MFCLLHPGYAEIVGLDRKNNIWYDRRMLRFIMSPVDYMMSSSWVRLGRAVGRGQYIAAVLERVIHATAAQNLPVLQRRCASGDRHYYSYTRVYT
jgi:hypothetical protein